MKLMQVIRTDLNMRKGKMCAQSGHAVTGILWQTHDDSWLKGEVERWIETGMKKVCVGVDSEEELLAVYAHAAKLAIPRYYIKDVGATEFHGVPTLTCCALGPCEEELMDKVTGHLRLL